MSGNDNKNAFTIKAPIGIVGLIVPAQDLSLILHGRSFLHRLWKYCDIKVIKIISQKNLLKKKESGAYSRKLLPNLIHGIGNKLEIILLIMIK